MTTSEVKFMDTRLPVPYLSQYKDIADRDHRLQACGMTCVYMTLLYFEAPVPSLDQMVGEGIQNGGYGKSGWFHEYFVKLFERLGHRSSRRENMTDRDAEDIRTAIRGKNPVIVSVTRRLWDQRLFHMVLITGIREDADGKLEGFFYHDPASLREEGSQHLFVPLPTFFLDWRRMAIFPEKD